MNTKIDISQVARSTPFDNTTNSFVSTNVQDALEEVDTAIEVRSQYVVMPGYAGNATTGKWLEFQQAVPSNDSGHVIVQASTLRALSISCKTATTCTASIYKNAVFLTSVTLSASRLNNVNNINLSLAANDELSAQISSGSAQNVTVSIFIRIDGA